MVDKKVDCDSCFGKSERRKRTKQLIITCFYYDNVLFISLTPDMIVTMVQKKKSLVC